MKKEKKKDTAKISKGMPSGFVISLVFHLAVFFLAGLFVVFTVVTKPEPEFTPPPPIERPKMKLKKPKVKVKKSSNPRPSSRIVAKVKTKQMPEIQLPDLQGVGEGLLGGSGFGGDFLDLPDMPTMTEFGSTESIGNDLVGTYWDLKYTRSGTFAPMTQYDWRRLYNEFVSSDDWDTSLFDRYYKGPRKLYAQTLILPPSISAMAPAAFGMPDKMCSGGYWIVYYRGKIVHKDGITFRFWLAVDDSMCIRIDGKIVVAASWIRPSDGQARRQELMYAGLWRSTANWDATYTYGHGKATVGDWVTLEPGVPHDIEVVSTDNVAANASAIVMVEEKGVDYPKNRQGAPILPIFRMAELSHDYLDLIYRNLCEDEANCTNGPIFSDFVSESKPARMAEAQEGDGSKAHRDPAEAAGSGLADGAEIETWSLKDGTTFEAELTQVLFNNAVFADTEGNIRKIPVDALSDESRSRTELLNPPRLDISLSKDFNTVVFPSGILEQATRPPEARAHHGFSIKQTSAGVYDHELKFEMYIIGTELNGSRKILLDKQEGTFVLNNENGRKYKFWSKRTVVYQDYVVLDDVRGEKYYGFLIVIRDERDKVVAVETSHNWLYDHYDNLRQRYAINFLDDQCERVYPTQPRSPHY